MKAVIIFGIVFIIGLIVLIGVKLSADAIAILIGVIVGVLAGFPVSLILVWALVRRTQQPPEPPPRQMGQQYPPVIIVGPGQPLSLPGYDSLPHPMLAPPRGQRSFKVVGDDYSEGEWEEQ